MAWELLLVAPSKACQSKTPSTNDERSIPAWPSETPAGASNTKASDGMLPSPPVTPPAGAFSQPMRSQSSWTGHHSSPNLRRGGCSRPSQAFGSTFDTNWLSYPTHHQRSRLRSSSHSVCVYINGSSVLLACRTHTRYNRSY